MSAFPPTSISRAKRVRPAVVLLLVLLAFSLPPGCATSTMKMKVYEGPNLPKAEIAVLKAPRRQFPSVQLWIMNFDGRRTQLRGPDPSRTFEFLPGRHNLSFSLGGGCSRREPGYIEFDAKVGHTYELRATNVMGRVWSWIVDNNTGEIVAGQKPHSGKSL